MGAPFLVVFGLLSDQLVLAKTYRSKEDNQSLALPLGVWEKSKAECIIYVKTKRKLIIWQLGLSLGSPLNCHIFCIMLNKTGFNSGGAIMLG